jgi:hypothetical protein
VTSHCRRLAVPGAFWRHLYLMVLAITLVLSGCIGSRSDATEPSPTPVATPLPTEQSNGSPGGMNASVMLVREAGDHESVAGSALVLAESGLLLTASDVLQEDIEIVLPDGSAMRPALVSVEPELELALLQIPVDDLTPIEFSAERPVTGESVFAVGYDGLPGSLGQMGGEITAIDEANDDLGYLVRGSLYFETDINLLEGFIGGALTADDGRFSGVLTPHRNEDDEYVGRAVSHWFIQAWIQQRESRIAELAEAAASWESIELPGGWSFVLPDNWSLNVSSDSEDTYRAELAPGDPEIPIQIAISVEPNEYGGDADAFIQQVFENRSSARIWSVTSVRGAPLVRATMTQEGSMVDVAYILDEEYLIAISMTSGYRTEEEPVRIDQHRALFETIIDLIDRS